VVVLADFETRRAVGMNPKARFYRFSAAVWSDLVNRRFVESDGVVFQLDVEIAIAQDRDFMGAAETKPDAPGIRSCGNFKVKFQLSAPAVINEVDPRIDMVQSLDSQYANALEAAVSLDDSAFRCTALQAEWKVDPIPILQSFFAVLPNLELELEQSTAGLSNCSQDWKDSAETIEKYLESGVVPSTLRKDEGAGEFHPTLIALLNSAYRFYIRSMPLLMNRIANADPNEVESRIRWTRRVENWTSKAIEDVLLLSKRPSK
jgi:hypothetical protein